MVKLKLYFAISHFLKFHTLAFVLGLGLLLLTDIDAYTREVHKNLPEDAFLFMELDGSNQQRWAADYMKAKAGGRYTGYCQQMAPPSHPIKEAIDYGNVDFCVSASDKTHYGAVGIARVGGIAPDLVFDAFYDDLLFFSWQFPNFGLYANNFTSIQHFINLLTSNEEGFPIRTQNHNDYDGYAYNASYGFPSLGLDYALAVGMNNASMTVNLPGCTHSNCAERYSIVPNGNPAIDYRQNNSQTPVGTPSGDKQTPGDGSNYNCYSDTLFNNCPDEGSKVGDYYQIPNTNPGGGGFFTSDQDWIVAEPGDNASTFYYNEFFLEGGTSRNDTLQSSAVVGRYYSIAAQELIYLGTVQHWTGDFNQPTHLWATLGYNHGDYETFADEEYGPRATGQSVTNQNYETPSLAIAHANSRQNRGFSYLATNDPRGNDKLAGIDRFLMEQGFLTYHLMFRPGHNKLQTTDKSVWRNVLRWAVPSAVAQMAIIYEKGILDLRKCRNSSTCNNS
ncbi:MAG: hypothetical protein KDK41_06860 [Leptospiraceae bacterium]|nr:hypothetical protein [Leptospiraceae bacterium]